MSSSTRSGGEEAASLTLVDLMAMAAVEGRSAQPVSDGPDTLLDRLIAALTIIQLNASNDIEPPSSEGGATGPPGTCVS
jgi:hypothetical protein